MDGRVVQDGGDGGSFVRFKVAVSRVAFNFLFESLSQTLKS